MVVTKKTIAFRHRNQTLDNFIKPRSILKQLCMWLVEVVNTSKQLSVLKNSVSSTGFQLLKPNCHFSELQIQKVMALMVTRVPFCF